MMSEPTTPPAPERAPDASAGPDLCPLSFAQRRLWFLDQLHPGSAAYNIVQAWRLEGDLDVAAFQNAIDTLVQRHETLRTTFSISEGEPVVVISAHQSAALRVIDLSAEPDAETAQRALIRAELERPFDLRSEPLFRVVVARLASRLHVVVFNLHHIIADAASFDVLRNEIVTVYRGARAGEPPDLPTLPMQYIDFAKWQRAQLAANSDSVHFWQEQLADPAPALELPTDYRPIQITSRGSSLPFGLGRDAVAALRNIATEHDATLFVLLTAAFHAFLHRITGQKDIVIGTAVTGRTRPETEGLIGLFVDTIPLRARFDDDPSFAALIDRTREIIFDALEHADAPFEKIVETLQPERDVDRNPLFQAVLTLRPAYPEHWEMGGLAASILDAETRTAKFDWTFLLEESETAVRGKLEFKTDLFEPATIERLLAAFRIFLEGIARNPDTRISQLPLLSADDRQRLLHSWSGASTVYERELSVHALFERQVEQTPDATAVIWNGERISYRELNQRADRLADRLRHAGIRPGTRTAFCLKRSPEMIVSILAILKAGSSYVPLDPNDPPDRLAFTLRDSGAHCILKHAAAPALYLPAGVTLLDVNEDFADPAPAIFIQPPTAALDPAYVMYTSGSTGTPKGVIIPHRAIVRLVHNTNYIQIRPDDVFLQLAPVSFDASTFEIWGALLNGASVVLYPDELPSLADLARTIEREKITVLWLTAGLFHQMIDEQVQSLAGLRCLLAGGDVLSVPHVLKAVNALPNCQFINGYGPTENTTFTCCHRVPSNWQGGRSVPIGQPVSNTRVYVLDSNMSLVPVGVPGELYTGGDGLALSYLNQPELTAGRFVPNPFVPGQRIYRTGDRVRWLPDGALEFLGRNDGQVKIRGYRIEPGEVEARLLEHPEVREAAVTSTISTDAAGRELVAGIVLHSQPDEPTGSETRLSASELRDWLAARLPACMIPARFIFLKSLPLTPNGKVDRAVIASIPPEPREDAHSAPPKDAIERILLSIWGDVLGRNGFGVTDNFFHLGGHSLLATLVISRVARAFQVELPVRALFEAPTVARFADRLRACAGAGGGSDLSIPRRNNAARLLSKLDTLSESEVETLLAGSGNKVVS